MEELQSTNDYQIKNKGSTSLKPPNFSKAVLLISIIIISSVLLQNIAGYFGSSIRIGLAVAGLMGIFLLVFSKHFIHVIDSPYFATSGLLGIALGTALGTFITQSASENIFTQRYGETGSEVLRFLQMDDVFHSWWYVALFVLLSASLIKIGLRKKFNWNNLGFHLAHFGPIIILAGFWIDYFYGYRGIIKLEEGESKNTVQLYNGLTNYIYDSTALDFAVRLDNFEFEKHDPDYRIQIWKRDTNSHTMQVAHGGQMVNQKPPTIVASLSAEAMKIRHIYGTEIYFRLKEIYPNFTFKYTYPHINEDIEPIDPGIQIDLKSPMGDGTLQLRANKPNRNKVLDEEIFGGWIEFYWEMPNEVKATLENPTTNNRIIFTGKDSTAYFVVNGNVTSTRLKTNEDFTTPNNENTTLNILHIFPDASLLKAVPSTKDENMVNPVARVEIWHKGKAGQEAYLYPGKSGKIGGTFNIPGSAHFLAYTSVKDMESKYYQSDISLVNQDGEVFKQQRIKVNEPLYCRGHRFYQTDYDPNNPSYSGIGVTHEPGLYLIYFGFYVLMAGVGLMFYGKYS